MLGVDSGNIQADSQPKSSGLGRRPLGAVLHSSNEPGELSQWLCNDDSTINIVLVIIIIIIIIIIALYLCRAFFKPKSWVNVCVLPPAFKVVGVGCWLLPLLVVEMVVVLVLVLLLLLQYQYHDHHQHHHMVIDDDDEDSH